MSSTNISRGAVLRCGCLSSVARYKYSWQDINHTKWLLKKDLKVDPDIGTYNKKATGRELDTSEEITIRLDTLVQLLHDKGIINKKELESRHLHEISKATAFQEIDEEL